MLLYYITDRRACPGRVERRIAEALVSGVDMVQVREKDLDGRELYELVRDVVAKKVAGQILVSARMDVALAAGADGVHLPSDAPSPARLRGAAAEGFAFGVSCHSLAEVGRAEQEGADFVVFGPVFETPSKARYGPPCGLRELAAACRRTSTPVLALGGVSLGNARACLDAGAAGVAGISMFQGATPAAEVVASLRALEASG